MGSASIRSADKKGPKKRFGLGDKKEALDLLRYEATCRKVHDEKNHRIARKKKAETEFIEITKRLRQNLRKRGLQIRGERRNEKESQAR